MSIMVSAINPEDLETARIEMHDIEMGYYDMELRKPAKKRKSLQEVAQGIIDVFEGRNPYVQIISGEAA